MAKSTQKAVGKNSGRTRSENVINDAAEGVIGLSPLVGVRQDDLTDALKSTTVQALKQPLIAAKHSVGFAGKLVDVVAGRSIIANGLGPVSARLRGPILGGRFYWQRAIGRR